MKAWFSIPKSREAEMFTVFCPRHHRRVLLSVADIRSLEPAPAGGFIIGYRCTCGHEGLWPEAPGEDDWQERMAG
jgi:hypothetical protein